MSWCYGELPREFEQFPCEYDGDPRPYDGVPRVCPSVHHDDPRHHRVGLQRRTTPARREAGDDTLQGGEFEALDRLRVGVGVRLNDLATTPPRRPALYFHFRVALRVGS